MLGLADVITKVFHLTDSPRASYPVFQIRSGLPGCRRYNLRVKLGPSNIPVKIALNTASIIHSLPMQSAYAVPTPRIIVLARERS
jgi:hypothetical protein